MPVLYIIGPSGAGKSALSKLLADIDQSITYINLDDALKHKTGYQHVTKLFDDLTPSGFWQQAYEVFQGLEEQYRGDQFCLVDVGAGTLETPLGRQYFIDRSNKLICIWGTPEAIWERKYKQQGWSLDRLKSIEYPPHRATLYDAAVIKLDTSDQSSEEALKPLQKAIADLKNKL
jgi:shikimate kinase